MLSSPSMHHYPACTTTCWGCSSFPPPLPAAALGSSFFPPKAPITPKLSMSFRISAASSSDFFGATGIWTSTCWVSSSTSCFCFFFVKMKNYGCWNEQNKKIGKQNYRQKAKSKVAVVIYCNPINLCFHFILRLHVLGYFSAISFSFLFIFTL